MDENNPKPKVEYSEFRRMLEEMRGNKQNSAQDSDNDLTNNIKDLAVIVRELTKNITTIIGGQRTAPMGKTPFTAALQNSNNPKIQSDEDQLEAIKREDEQTELLRIIAKNTTKEKVNPQKPEEVGFGGALTGLVLAGTALAGFLTGYITTMFKILKGISQSFVKLLKSTYELLLPESLRRGIRESFTKIATFFSEMVSRIKALFIFDEASIIGRVFKQIKTGFTFVTEAFKTVFEAIKSVGSFITKLASGSSKIMSLLKVAGRVFAVFSIIGNIALVIEGLYKTISGAIEGWKQGGFMGAITGALKGFFGNFIARFLDDIKSVFSWVLGALGFTGIEKFLDSFSFEKITNDFIEAVMAPLQFLQDVIMHPIESLKKLGKVMSDAFDKIAKVFDPMIEFFSNIGKSIVGMLENIVIPEMGFTIPVIGKKVSIGPFYPFKKKENDKTITQSGSEAGGGTAATKPAKVTDVDPKNQNQAGTKITLKPDEVAAVKEAIADPKTSARDKAYYEEMLKNQPAWKAEEQAAQKAAQKAAVADTTSKMPAAQVANVTAEKSKYRMGLEQEFAARVKAANGYALVAGNGQNPDGTANKGMIAFMDNEARMRELDGLIEKDDNARKTGKPTVPEVSKNKAPEKVSPAVVPASPAVATPIKASPIVEAKTPSVATPIKASPIVEAKTPSVATPIKAKTDTAEQTRMAAKQEYQAGTKEEEAAKQKLKEFEKANPFDYRAKQTPTQAFLEVPGTGKFSDPKKQKEYDALMDTSYKASDKKENAKLKYETSDKANEYKTNKFGQQEENLGAIFAKKDVLLSRFGYKESDLLNADGQSYSISKINTAYDKNVNKELMSTATPKASPIVEKVATPIPGGGQTVNPSAQNYNAKAAGTETKAPEKASPIVEGKKVGPTMGELKSKQTVTPEMQKMRDMSNRSTALAQAASTGNTIEAKTGDVANSRDALTTSGNAGTAIVNAPTTVNNSSQNTTIAKSPFRNEEGTINKYYSTRLGAY